MLAAIHWARASLVDCGVSQDIKRKCGVYGRFLSGSSAPSGSSLKRYLSALSRVGVPRVRIAFRSRGLRCASGVRRRCWRDCGCWPRQVPVAWCAPGSVRSSAGRWHVAIRWTVVKTPDVDRLSFCGFFYNRTTNGFLPAHGSVTVSEFRMAFRPDFPLRFTASELSEFFPLS